MPEGFAVIEGADVISGHERPPPESHTSSKAAVFAKFFTVALVIYAAGGIAVGIFVSNVFGPGCAIGLSLIVACPLVIGLRMRRRLSAMVGRDFVLLVCLMTFACSSATYLVHNWYDNRLDDDHTKDVKYAELEQSFESDPAFSDLKLNLSKRKHVYWVSGTVDTEADLDRLKSLAAKIGIKGTLHGPYAHSKSIEVRRSSHETNP